MHSNPPKAKRRTEALFLRLRPDLVKQIKSQAAEHDITPSAYIAELVQQREARARVSFARASHRLASLLQTLLKKGDVPAYTITQLQHLQRTFIDAWMGLKAPYDATHDARGEEQWGG
jgi:hypothetical protein